MRHVSVVQLIACLLALGGATAVEAQEINRDPGAGAMMHFGSLALTPRAGVRDVGIDTNVLNASGTPQRDFTATFATGADVWLGSGQTRLTSKTDLGWVYFRELADQRSFEVNEQLRLDFILTRLTPYAAAGYERTRQRPNLEIDARALRMIRSARLGTVLHAGANVSVDLNAGVRQYVFAEDQTIQDIALATALNRTETQAGALVKFALTPLTSAVVSVAAQEDRFEFSPVRNSNSLRVLPGFEFKPVALIAGSVAVGYRRFDALSPDVPDFRGLIAAVDASYTARETTRLALQFNRDIEYSYELTSPYYVATGGTLTLTQAIANDWDAIGRAGRTTMAYQALVGLTPIPDVTGRRDEVVTYGGGVGRRIGSDLRVGFNVDWTNRRSVVVERQYTGVRAGGSVTYGF